MSELNPAYEKYGRLIQTITDSQILCKNIVSYKYNFTSQLLKLKENHVDCCSGSLSTLQRIEYDNGSRLTNVYYKIGNTPEILLSQNVYDEIGQISKKNLHKSANGFVQQVDYKYNICKWLEKINDISSPDNDLFAMSLNYASGATPQFNGNISEMEWNSVKFAEPKKYTFTYDKLNRMTNAAFSNNGNYNEALTYDRNGNILTLSRNGLIGSESFGSIDNLTYGYSGNQITHINDLQNSTNQNNGFKDNGSFVTNEYLYDQNGNMVKDLNKQIENIIYHPQNLPQKIEIAASQPQWILYLYDATGKKIKKQTRENQAIISTTVYDMSFIYENDELAYIVTPEGRALPEGDAFRYEYNLKDHLGNTRAVFDQNKTIIQDYSYYPFGMIQEGLHYNGTAQNSPNKYLYNGKELQADFNLDWYDYGARFYDAVVGRWWSVDPLAEKYKRWSPYNYCVDNPMRFIDTNGMLIDDYFNKEGQFLGSDNAITDNVKIIDSKDWNSNKQVTTKRTETIDHEKGVALSTNFSENTMTEEATLNVYNHYNPTGLTLVSSLKENGNGGMALSTKRKNGNVEQKIIVKVEGNKKTKLADHANEITNSFVHEKSHYDDSRSYGLDAYLNTPKETREQRAISTQMNHSSFIGTRPEYQNAIRSYGIQHAMIFPLRSLPAIVIP